MMGGRAAASTLLDMRSTGDFSAASTAVYKARWMAAYGHDFPMSTAFAHVIYRCGGDGEYPHMRAGEGGERVLFELVFFWGVCYIAHNRNPTI